jgi:hypothetical protein
MPFPVDISYINDAERKLGVRFPASFVVRMSKRNGGDLPAAIDVWQLHPFLDTSDRTRLKRTCNDIVTETKKARQRPSFPEHAVAIGANGGGDELILLPRPDANNVLGPLYWWDHETGELKFICDDFSDLEPADEGR